MTQFLFPGEYLDKNQQNSELAVNLDKVEKKSKAAKNQKRSQEVVRNLAHSPIDSSKSTQNTDKKESKNDLEIIGEESSTEKDTKSKTGDVSEDSAQTSSKKSHIDLEKSQAGSDNRQDKELSQKTELEQSGAGYFVAGQGSEIAEPKTVDKEENQERVSSKITKAVFVAAGFGTRFLPITKAVPKEMLPIIDKPIIQYLVEEVVAAGIQEIIFVTGRGKSAIENHFDTSYELEKTLVEKGKLSLVSEVEKISQMASFAYVRQPVQKGDGHALLQARPFVGSDPVLVVFPDYILPAKNHTFKKMLKSYQVLNLPIIATDTVDMADTQKYGVIKPDDAFAGSNFVSANLESSLENAVWDKKTLEEAIDPKNIDPKNHNSEEVWKMSENIVKVESFVEKPKQNPPSNLINCGYAIIDKTIWDILDEVEKNSLSSTADGEIRLADAYIQYLQNGGNLYALKSEYSGYDCGSQIGFLKATVAFALERKEIHQEFVDFLNTVLGR